MSVVPDLSAKIISVFIGKVEDRWPDKAPSAIRKTATDAVLTLKENGFLEDNQADKEVHGGPEKAIHHYAADHMDHWRSEFADKAEFFKPGCFGENISTIGLTEENLCLGDVLTMGTAKVQICQGRQPCWKLNAHTDIAQMAPSFQRSGRTGWYYRVIEDGEVKAGDEMRLIERPCPNWSLARLIKARFDPRIDPDEAKELSDNPILSQAWRKSFLKKADRNFIENTDARLKG